MTEQAQSLPGYVDGDDGNRAGVVDEQLRIEGSSSSQMAALYGSMEGVHTAIAVPCGKFVSGMEDLLRRIKLALSGILIVGIRECR